MVNAHLIYYRPPSYEGGNRRNLWVGSYRAFNIKNGTKSTDILSTREDLYSYSSSRYLTSGVESISFSGSEEREFEPHSGSDEVTPFPPSVYHNYGDSYDGGSYQSIGLTAKLPQPD